ncbi:MAG TPA: GNAT family acetyltransferase, partial [Acholeplasmataceae bacterium]|nr:GNAT family acetyltransferase [Acholeplasmataceae bacterium]
MKVTEKELLDQGYRKYHGKTIDVFFKREKCIKSTNCVKGNSEVFDTSRKPWIVPDNAEKDEVKSVIDTCPSGALKYLEKEQYEFLFEDGRFYLEDENKKMIAEVTYTKVGEKILIIDHTFVDPV